MPLNATLDHYLTLSLPPSETIPISLWFIWRRCWDCEEMYTQLSYLSYMRCLACRKAEKRGDLKAAQGNFEVWRRTMTPKQANELNLMLDSLTKTQWVAFWRWITLRCMAEIGPTGIMATKI